MHRVQLRHHRVEDLLVLHLDEVELLPVLAVAAVLFFGVGVALGQDLFFTHDITGSDFWDANYPGKKIYADALATGELPHWTPLIGTGFPVTGTFETDGPVSRHFDGAGYKATTGIGDDLMQAARDAVSGMVDWISATTGMSTLDAYMLCSVCGDLRISEIVDMPNWTVSFYFPKTVLG